MNVQRGDIMHDHAASPRRLLGAKALATLSALLVIYLLSGLLPKRPGWFFLDVILFAIVAAGFYCGGVVDGRGPAIPPDHQTKEYAVLRVMRLFLAACGGILITGTVAVVLSPPDPFSMLISFVPLSVVFGILYLIGLRKGQSQPPREMRVSFTRPFQYFLAFLMGIDGLLIAIFPSGGLVVWILVGSFFLVCATAVLFAFGPRWNRTVDRAA